MRGSDRLGNAPKASQLVEGKMHVPRQVLLNFRSLALPHIHHAAQMFWQIWITEMLEVKLCSLKDGHLKNCGLWLPVVEMIK